ncbi:hypothetical protein BUQ74_19710 [Leptospira weilii serovar Heyan]|uniref:Uncharacterized protein n=1 Tax=Leptospira weilii str. UI 13098 TaxID=1088542 RepID=M6QJ62_9LEPT|nr:hypothetical protein LEP1GSC086_1730 [Leptospira weilii str. LNT 1234]EMN44994.1 hypothetical protein LEP1GSC086_1325 [Leptospira weilii str. LNT 1234]EMN92533.1 hypothetical protein LEP1GSC108_3789 [Leptospira weilii str. UI 13098]OMI15315.1 hypothetical protein BUQ74_19710 [Leptospira weilii serovar Heyan]
MIVWHIQIAKRYRSSRGRGKESPYSRDIGTKMYNNGLKDFGLTRRILFLFLKNRERNREKRVI